MATTPEIRVPTVTLRDLRRVPTVAVRFTAPIVELPQRVPAALQEVMAEAGRARAPFAGPPFALYRSMGPGGVEVDVGVPLRAPIPDAALLAGRLHAGELPAGRAAVALHVGAYDTIQVTYEGMQAWARQHGHTLGEVMWESYLSDPHEETDPATWRTEIVWPLAG